MSARRLAFAVVAVAALAMLGACGEIDTTALAPIDDYQTWRQFPPQVGAVDGHGSSYREIFVNDVASEYAHAGRYRDGAVLVKRIHALGPGNSKGPLSYVAIMRKLDEPPDDLPTDGGWLFTKVDGEVGVAGERHFSLCWNTCHRQAPWDGVYFDYGE